jgi:hypothetical protein
LKPLPISAVAAVGGVIGLAGLFPRLDPSPSARLTLDRSHTIERVRQLADRYGLDTAGWQTAVTDQTDAKLKRYLAAYPDDPVARLFGLVKLNVRLIEPGRKHSVEVVLFADGRPAQWKWNGAKPEVRSGPAPDTVLTDFIGSRPGRLTPAGVSDDGASRYDWEWKAADRFPLRATLKMEQKAGAVLSVMLVPVYSDAFEEQYKASQKNTLATVANWAGILVWTTGLGLCVLQMIRGKLRWRIPLMLLAAQLLWAAVSFWGGTYYQEFLGRKQSVLDALFLMAAENSAVVWSFFWLPVFAGAGYAIRSAGNREKWHSLDEISSGRILNRATGESLAVGLLSGIGLAALPYIVTAVRWLPGNSLDFRSMDALVAPSPSIVALRMSAAVPALALFGFLFPFTRYLRKPILFWMVLAPLGVLVTMDSTPFRAVAPATATAVLFFGGYLWVYLRSDLLAVLMAAIAARAAIVPWVLFSQPLSSMRESALGLFTLGAAALAASVYWALRGAEPDAQATAASFSPEAEAPAKPDRERLKAEFEVARKAQQDALPADPPVMEGYSLAGWCEPAQQVGGDLYDFFPLPDGRLGIAVADVSGKGVPAALYMMVTKGLLTAVSRDSNQLAYILEQINLHLYRACRKKVFVTMAAVVLDSSNRRLEYGRAGHNPVVWRRTRRGQTALVKPPGLGLGMTPGERFTRSLRIEELELEPQDAIVLYSDGVTEAVNHAMEQFGEARLMRAVESTDGQSAIDSRDAILRDLAEFRGAAPARDDITLVVIRA